MKNNESTLVKRYKRNYSIPKEELVTEEMILQHWELEKQLTRELLASLPTERWEVFERCYTRLYSELHWLNVLTGEGSRMRNNEYDKWRKAIGEPPLRVYEIGSGKGNLLAYLGKKGFVCKGTEITQERGEKLATPQMNLTWGRTDGVHLDRFDPVEEFDVVLSNQVIEHLHPDDVLSHLESTCKILKPTGKYVFSTPHIFTGPHDISWVFKTSQSKGMHLKEYTYRQLVGFAANAGFSCVYYAGFPPKLHNILLIISGGNPEGLKNLGKAYLRFLLLVEWVLQFIPNVGLRCVIAEFFDKIKLFNDNIFLTAQKN